MNISEIISIIHDVLSMVSIVLTTVYTPRKDARGSEHKAMQKGKRNNRRKRR